MERASSLPSLYDVREVSYPQKAGSWYRMLCVCELPADQLLTFFAP